MPRSLSEGVDIFLKSAERQGESGHDVRVSRSAPWMACVGGPVMMRTAISLFVENSHLETRHQGVMFRSLRAFVGSMATLRYRSSPMKNSASVPGPEWDPMVGPT